MELYRNKGEMCEAGSHRGILLSDAIAKHFHRFFRERTVGPLESIARDAQRGVGRRGVDFARHILQEYAGWCRAESRAMVAIFIDV
eukprot:2140253-Lingulodinium_polyedra.AAC.1